MWSENRQNAHSSPCAGFCEVSYLLLWTKQIKLWVLAPLPFSAASPVCHGSTQARLSSLLRSTLYVVFSLPIWAGYVCGQETHNPLPWILNSAKLNENLFVCSQSWLSDFTKVGKLNKIPTVQDVLHFVLFVSLLHAEKSQLECSSWLAAPCFCPHYLKSILNLGVKVSAKVPVGSFEPVNGPSDFPE